MNLRDEALMMLDYEPSTGEFKWKTKRGSRTAKGRPAGWISSLGYRVIGIGNRQIYAHRLAWLIVHGEMPSGMIDHADGNQENNAIGNLRIASKSLNGANRGPQANNTSGFKGVVKHYRKWIAQINVNGKNKYLGLFETPELASKAYLAAAEKEYGEFSRVS